MLNPDGYDYSWTTNRFWLKNRRQDFNCTGGVNLNRNFPSFWRPNTGCTFKNYSGPFPMSEPEVESVVSYVTENLLGQTVLALSLHCFGQVFFIPYAGTPSIDHPRLAVRKQCAHIYQISQNISNLWDIFSIILPRTIRGRDKSCNV